MDTSLPQKTWYFVIYVRCGARTILVDKYTSSVYYSFEQCYTDYLKFAPCQHWFYLRRILNESIIYKCGNQVHENRIANGTVKYINSLQTDLGITAGKLYGIVNREHNVHKRAASCCNFGLPRLVDLQSLQ